MLEDVSSFKINILIFNLKPLIFVVLVHGWLAEIIYFILTSNITWIY